MIGMSIKRISVLNLCHVLKPFVKSTPGLGNNVLIYYIGAHENKVVTQMCNIKTSHYDIRFHVLMDFGNIRLTVMDRDMIF